MRWKFWKKKKPKLEMADLEMVSWDELSDKMKAQVQTTTFVCMLCGKEHTGMAHNCGDSE